MVHVEVFKTFLPILYWRTNLLLYIVIYWYFCSVCRQCFCLRIVCLTNVSILQQFSCFHLREQLYMWAHMHENILDFFRPTFKRIVRNKSTEQFSGLPYIYSLLNCLICMWYGLPWVSYGVILVATVNSIGAAFQLAYVSLFIRFADSAKRVCIVS